MKINVPESKDDITLSQYVEITKIPQDSDDYDRELFSIVTGVDINLIDHIPVKNVNNIVLKIKEALSRDGVFKKVVTIKGKNFGLIPNFDKITGGEYDDLVENSKVENGMYPNLITLMSVLYRPITKTDTFVNYKIEPYENTLEIETYIKDMPLSNVNGALSFFLTLSNQLEMHFLRSIQEVQQRGALAQVILKSGGSLLVFTI